MMKGPFSIYADNIRERDRYEERRTNDGHAMAIVTLSDYTSAESDNRRGI